MADSPLAPNLVRELGNIAGVRPPLHPVDQRLQTLGVFSAAVIVDLYPLVTKRRSLALRPREQRNDNRMDRSKWWPEARPKASNVKPWRSRKRTREVFLGSEVVLSGELTSCGTLVSEATIESNRIECREFILSSPGSIKGAVQAENAVISGSFQGRLVVRARLLIKSGGHVSGSVQYGRIEIEPGGELQGDIVMCPSPEHVVENGLEMLDILPRPKSGRATVNSVSAAHKLPLAGPNGGPDRAIEVTPDKRELAHH